MNRPPSVPECRNSLLVVIDQDNLVPQIRKTRSRYQPHVPRPDHRDAHSEPSPWISFAPPARRCADSYCSSLSSPDSISIVSAASTEPRNGNSNLTKSRDPHHRPKVRPSVCGGV